MAVAHTSHERITLGDGRIVFIDTATGIAVCNRPCARANVAGGWRLRGSNGIQRCSAVTKDGQSAVNGRGIYFDDAAICGMFRRYQRHPRRSP